MIYHIMEWVVWESWGLLIFSCFPNERKLICVNLFKRSGRVLCHVSLYICLLIIVLSSTLGIFIVNMLFSYFYPLKIKFYLNIKQCIALKNYRLRFIDREKDCQFPLIFYYKWKLHLWSLIKVLENYSCKFYT